MVLATKVLLSVAVVAGGGGVLIYSSLAEADYYKHVDEVTGKPDRWVDKNLKIHGFVEAGSIDEKIVGQTQVRTFVLEYKGERIHVRHKGPKPDTFRDLAEVVAQGKLVAGNEGPVLEATELMAKCPSKYEAERRGRAAPPGVPSKTGAAPGIQASSPSSR
jgi:cytochrome c-type biogenesis protein CcmE